MNMLERAWTRLVNANAISPHQAMVQLGRHTRNHRGVNPQHSREMHRSYTWKSHGGFRR